MELNIYQIAWPALLKANRNDGTGWEWSWCPVQRDWMDATSERYAYRCLPLNMANQCGLWVLNPIGFTVTWNGNSSIGTNIAINFDNEPDLWKTWIHDVFGSGILTWNIPYLFKTKPAGSRLLIMSPANSFKPHVQALTAIIESDWSNSAFTMNYKILTPNHAIRFEVGEPICQIIPISTNICGDLENATVTVQPLESDKSVYDEYHKWDTGRTTFMQDRLLGKHAPSAWQKDYYRGSGNTRIRHPKIEYKHQ